MKVLDHGEVNLVETWGSDENIIRAARQSTDGAFRGWEDEFCYTCPVCQYTAIFTQKVDDIFCPNACGAAPMPVGERKGDARLLRYLYTHKHMTPFEMCGAIFEVKAPIFVFREWHRHRTQSYNEMSARYIPIPDENYVPTVERLMMEGGTNKQAQGTGVKLIERTAELFQHELREHYAVAQELYTFHLQEGVPKELARLVLPVGRYSKMWASANLRNWMQFLELRNDAAAQWEIQQYAKAVQSLLKEAFPRTLALFEEDR